MMISYAEAMKRKQQLAQQPSLRNNDYVQKPAAGPKRESSWPSSTSSSGNHKSSYPPHQSSNAEARTASKPPASAWGKNHSSNSSATKTTAAAPIRNPQNPWGKQSSAVTKPSSAQTDQKSNAVSKNPAVRILRKDRPSDKDKPSGNIEASPWKTVAAGHAPTKKYQPSAESKSQTQNSSVPKPDVKDNQPRHFAQPVKNKKKPKPQSKAMSIGDMMMQRPGNKPQKTAQKTEQATTKSESKQTSLAMDSSTDFPALGSLSTTTTKSKPILSKSGWGKPSPSAKQAPAVEPSSQKSKKAETSPKKAKVNNNKTTNASATVTPSAQTAAMFFQPKSDAPREGDEHQLLRLLQDRTVYQKRGRQRLNPRKKKFTALKKKVLQERLDNWHALHPEDEKEQPTPTSISNGTTISSCTICIYNYVHPDEIQDDEEYEEILENLKEMASKMGTVHELLIPRHEVDREENYPVFVRFTTSKDAAAAQACWEGLVVGGQKLHASLIPIDDDSINKDNKWTEKVVSVESSLISGESSAASDTQPSGAIINLKLSDILTEDDYDDGDCMEESLQDLRSVAAKLGKIQNLEPNEAKDGSVLLTYEAQPTQAAEILKQLKNTTIGGKSLSVELIESASLGPSSVVVLENILTEEDLEDEECLAETLEDIKELAGRHGAISDVQVADQTVRIIYEGPRSIALATAQALNGLTLGGVTVMAHAETEHEDNGNFAYLHNILTEDDLEDEECLQESLNDIRNIASKYGKVRDLEVIKENETSLVRVAYEGGKMSTAKSAVAEFGGMMIGGQIVSATLQPRIDGEGASIDQAAVSSDSDNGKRKSSDEAKDFESKKARTDDLKPLYSGDKLIPERFAEAKRVPKIPNNPGPREYAKVTNDARVRPLLHEMLGELMRLQKRAVEENKTKAKRRLVMGLREVARGIRSHKVKMVIMANNLDEYGVIDEKLQEIIDLAHNEAVPLFFEFTKRSLGKAVAKSIKVAVVGVQNAEGAHQPFKKLVSLASKI